jgi:succinate dehydrogenase/fumarate reductase cytochrome b subunit
MKKPKNLGFEPVHPKNVLFASVVHGISCLFTYIFIYVRAHLHATPDFMRKVEKKEETSET